MRPLGTWGATAVFISVSVFGVNEEEGTRVECTTKVKRGATPGPWGPTGPSGHIVHKCLSLASAYYLPIKVHLVPVHALVQVMWKH